MTEIIKDLVTEKTVNGIKIPKRPKIKQGAFQIYTGEGKGKSTASLGLMLRAWVQECTFIMCGCSNRAGKPAS